MFIWLFDNTNLQVIHTYLFISRIISKSLIFILYDPIHNQINALKTFQDPYPLYFSFLFSYWYSEKKDYDTCNKFLSSASEKLYDHEHGPNYIRILIFKVYLVILCLTISSKVRFYVYMKVHYKH